ncbi:MAG: MerR family transcriptional regulator [Spirochaetia bacterium]
MKNPDELLFNINQVAKQIGVVPGTIRNWEKEGLFAARRTTNNYRVYSFDDINFLKRVKELSVDQRLSYDVIKKMLKYEIMQQKTDQQNGSSNPQYSKKFLSKKWRTLREETGYTLDEVSTELGISPSYLSKIETGQANISFDVLQRLADFYNQNILYFFEEEDADTKLVQHGSGSTIDIGLEGVAITNLVADKTAHVKSMYYTIQPSCGNYVDHSHFGEEFVYLMEGQLEFTLNDTQVYNLEPGDSLFFHSSEKHKWINNGSTIATALWIYSPFRE